MTVELGVKKVVDYINISSTQRQGVEKMVDTYTVDTDLPMTAQIGVHIMNVHAVASGKTSADMPCDITGAYPNTMYSGTSRVTPAKARAALARWLKAAKAEMPDQARDMCADIPKLVRVGYKVGGKNPRTEPLFAYALLRIRRADKRAQRAAKHAAALESAAKDGGVWYAANTGDKPYPSAQKARKGHAREAFGGDWWKVDKSARIDAAVVRQGKPYAAKSSKKAAPAKVQSTPAVKVTVAVLRKQCSALGLSTRGTKAELAQRVTDALGL